MAGFFDSFFSDSGGGPTSSSRSGGTDLSPKGTAFNRGGNTSGLTGDSTGGGNNGGGGSNLLEDMFEKLKKKAKDSRGGGGGGNYDPGIPNTGGGNRGQVTGGGSDFIGQLISMLGRRQ